MSIQVVSQMSFRTQEDAGDYQDYVYDETGFEAQLRQVDKGYAVITVVSAKNKTEADAVASYLREFEWQGRKPQVVITTREGKTSAPEPADVPIDTDKITEARRRYEESEKAKEYRRQFRKTKAFKESQQRYQQSSAGRAAQRRYAQSEQGRERRKIYQQSEKGKQRRKEYQERRRAIIQQLREEGRL